MSNEIERCLRCNGVLAIIGRMHNCVPRVALPVTAFRDNLYEEAAKPRFGDVVNVPLSEMPARGIGPKQPKDLTEAVLEEALEEAATSTKPLAIKPTKVVLKRDPLSAQSAGPAPARPAKPRAKKGTGVYGFRNADEHRAYMREYMRKRRAKA